MSIAIGIYDLFSYLIPGALYLYLINDFLRVVGWQYIDLTRISFTGDAAPGLLSLIVVGVGAYVVGHIFETLRSVILDHWLYHGAPDRALAKIRGRLSHSNIEVDFNFDDWSLFQEGLKARNENSIGDSERYKADALMMRNFSFGAILYSLIQFLHFLKQTSDWYHLLLLILGFVLSFLTYQRAKRFDEWYYRTIYSQALVYGSSLREFLENSTPAWKVQEKHVQKSLKRVTKRKDD